MWLVAVAIKITLALKSQDQIFNQEHFNKNFGTNYFGKKYENRN